MATGTTIERDRIAERNAAVVLAESSLAGERRVSVIRIAMFALFGVSQELMGPLYGLVMQRDVLRDVVIASYGIYGLTTFFILRRSRTSVRQALYWPLFHATVDIGFMTFMAVRGWKLEHRVSAEMGAIIGAIIISFSVARAGIFHVVYSTFLSCAFFLGITLWTGVWRANNGGFVLGGFIALGLLIAVTNHSVHRLFRDLRARDNLSRFLPRPLVDRIVRLGDSALLPVSAEVTVLFSDLRDFTTLSESLSPRELLELLDDYFSHMSQIVKAHDGIVNKFIGDGMLAFWNVPERDPQHAERALRAALDMRTRLAELNAVREKRGLAPLRFGVGIHSGSVAAGMLGGADQHEYTVIGDAVNVASRIEGLTKSLSADILVSDATMAKVGDRFEARRIGEQPVKGRAGVIGVHALDGLRSTDPS